MVKTVKALVGAFMAVLIAILGVVIYLFGYRTAKNKQLKDEKKDNDKLNKIKKNNANLDRKSLLRKLRGE